MAWTSGSSVCVTSCILALVERCRHGCRMTIWVVRPTRHAPRATWGERVTTWASVCRPGSELGEEHAGGAVGRAGDLFRVAVAAQQRGPATSMRCLADRGDRRARGPRPGRRRRAPRPWRSPSSRSSPWSGAGERSRRVRGPRPVGRRRTRPRGDCRLSAVRAGS
jgi:hypothetical protein